MLDLLEKLYAQSSLEKAEAEQLFSAVVNGEMSEPLLAAMLTALKIKGETAQEIAGAASALRASANQFPTADYDYLDCVGTGGDGHHTINISTTAAIVAASMGLKMAKHGNRSVSSKSGSADLLEAFDIDLTMSAETAKLCLDEANICFLFAPAYHPGFKYAVPVRKQLQTRTIFNCLGPLVNPAKPKQFLLGVYTPELVKPFAEALKLLGVTDAWVVHGAGLDEIALHGDTQVAVLSEQDIVYKTLSPEDFGLPEYPLDAIKGGTPEVNAAIVKSILSGNGEAAHVAAVSANVAALLVINKQFDDLEAATAAVQCHISSGKAIETLNTWVSLSQQHQAKES